MEIKAAIKEKGLLIGFLEKEMNVPKNTFYNYVNGSKKTLPAKHLSRIKKVLKKHKINYEV